MPTSGARWREIERLLDGALDLDPAARARYLDRRCAGDAQLRAEVEALLHACDDAGGFLGGTAVHFILAPGDRRAPPDPDRL